MLEVRSSIIVPPFLAAEADFRTAAMAATAQASSAKPVPKVVSSQSQKLVSSFSVRTKVYTENTVWNNKS